MVRQKPSQQRAKAVQCQTLIRGQGGEITVDRFGACSRGGGMALRFPFSISF